MGIERYDQLVQEFLGKKRLAIWGIEDAKSDPGRLVARKLHRQGIEVISVNPRFSDDPTQRRASSLTKIEPPVEAVLVYVDPPKTMEAVNDCVAAKIPMVWLHDALSPGAAIPAAIEQAAVGGLYRDPWSLPYVLSSPGRSGSLLSQVDLAIGWEGKTHTANHALTVNCSCKTIAVAEVGQRAAKFTQGDQRSHFCGLLAQ